IPAQLHTGHPVRGGHPLTNTTSDRTTEDASPRRGIELFRGRDATGLVESETMTPPELDADSAAFLAEATERTPNLVNGSAHAAVFLGEAAPGVSLSRDLF